MHSHYVRSLNLGLALAMLAPCATAIEATTAPNDRASQAAIFRQLAANRADQLAEIAAIQAQVDAMLTCTRKGRFYAPGEPQADADSCTVIAVTVIE